MIVVRGKRTEATDRGEMERLVAAYEGVTVDLGCGDGRFAYRYAGAHHERFVIGIDPVAENMREMSARAARKPARGGLPNVLYVVASVERLPDELRGVAGEIFVTLPWGSLMRGVILAEPAVLDGIASLARDRAELRIVLNTRIFDEPVPADLRDLPEVTPDYARDTLALAYARHGIEIRAARWMDADEVAAVSTTWAKRLSHRAPPRSVAIECVVRTSP